MKRAVVVIGSLSFVLMGVAVMAQAPSGGVDAHVAIANAMNQGRGGWRHKHMRHAPGSVRISARKPAVGAIMLLRGTERRRTRRTGGSA